MRYNRIGGTPYETSVLLRAAFYKSTNIKGALSKIGQGVGLSTRKTKRRQCTASDFSPNWIIADQEKRSVTRLSHLDLRSRSQRNMNCCQIGKRRLPSLFAMIGNYKSLNLYNGRSNVTDLTRKSLKWRSEFLYWRYTKIYKSYAITAISNKVKNWVYRQMKTVFTLTNTKRKCFIPWC